MIYLDYAATTPIDPKVIEVMYEFMKTCYGNPSSKYYEQADMAKKYLREARKHVADLINCDPDEITFNSGATEGNNFIIKGIANAHKDKGRHIITSKIEHKSVLETCKYLETQGFEVTYLDVNSVGAVETETLKNAIRHDTILVSLIWGNNEIGTLNDIVSLGNICKERDVFFHTDATQVVGKVDVDMNYLPVDFLTFSGHKLNGPKGVGACFIRNDKFGFKPDITSLIHGGKQENSLRAGTESMVNIVGFGAACNSAFTSLSKCVLELKNIEQRFINHINSNVSNVILLGDFDSKVLGIVCFCIPGVNNEYIIRKLSKDYSFSSGSACSITEPSHVIAALPTNYNNSHFRVSFKHDTSFLDLSNLIDSLNDVISKL